MYRKLKETAPRRLNLMNMDFNTIFWLGIWYLLVAAFIGFFIFFFRFINMPKWRDDHGDRTSEVGYFEDEFGRIISGPLDNEEEHENGDVAAPHVQAASNSNAGII